MPQYNLTVAGLEISIKTDADEKRVTEARNYVEEAYDKLSAASKNISKERLLTVIALGLADEFLQTRKDLRQIEDKLGKLLTIE